jgi:hypothetical protein
MKLSDHASPYHRLQDTTTWQHNKTSKVFRTTELMDGSYGLELLINGKWQNEGRKTIGQIVTLISQ